VAIAQVGLNTSLRHSRTGLFEGTMKSLDKSLYLLLVLWAYESTTELLLATLFIADLLERFSIIMLAQDQMCSLDFDLPEELARIRSQKM